MFSNILSQLTPFYSAFVLLKCKAALFPSDSFLTPLSSLGFLSLNKCASILLCRRFTYLSLSHRSFKSTDMLFNFSVTLENPSNFSRQPKFYSILLYSKNYAVGSRSFFAITGPQENSPVCSFMYRIVSLAEQLGFNYFHPGANYR